MSSSFSRLRPPVRLQRSHSVSARTIAFLSSTARMTIALHQSWILGASSCAQHVCPHDCVLEFLHLDLRGIVSTALPQGCARDPFRLMCAIVLPQVGSDRTNLSLTLTDEDLKLEESYDLTDDGEPV
jgi:hypothetical protein